jgi:hypothetical protein
MSNAWLAQKQTEHQENRPVVRMGGLGSVAIHATHRIRHQPVPHRGQPDAWAVEQSRLPQIASLHGHSNDCFHADTCEHRHLATFGRKKEVRGEGKNEHYLDDVTVDRNRLDSL